MNEEIMIALITAIIGLFGILVAEIVRIILSIKSNKLLKSIERGKLQFEVNKIKYENLNKYLSEIRSIERELRKNMNENHEKTNAERIILNIFYEICNLYIVVKPLLSKAKQDNIDVIIFDSKNHAFTYVVDEYNSDTSVSERLGKVIVDNLAPLNNTINCIIESIQSEISMMDFTD